MDRKTHQDEINFLVDELMNVDIMETELSPIIISHPFFDTGIQMDENHQMVDILKSDENFSKIKSLYLKKLHNKSPLHILYKICKPYRMFFVKMAFPYLSDNDRGELLREAWITQENPNEDINVSHDDIECMFLQCKPEFLMEKEDYEVWKKLPDVVHIYRGIHPNKKHEAFSWTLDKEVARWFANRFDRDGMIIEKDIRKELIVAYFNIRDEQEIIVMNEESYGRKVY